ncbi:MAG: YihY/virulence factor BrkB family protein [Limisphaerales bacterium]
MANESVAKLKKIQAEAQAFLDEKGMGLQDEAAVPRWRKFVHFWVMVGTSFVRNRCPMRASALAYTTLLSLIPLLAIAVSVTTSLVRKEEGAPIQRLIDQLVANVAPALNLQVKEDGVDAGGGTGKVAKQINDFISNIQSGTLGVTSVIALVFVAISLLATIEATFNDIWGVPGGRSWFVRVMHYWAAITLGPLALIVAIGLNLGPYLAITKNVLEEMPFVGTLLYNFLPLLLLSVAFGIFYQLMPNTKVHWKAALAGGLVGGTLFHLNNSFSVIYVSRVVTYSKIYGSLGMVPVFLAGLYFSWLIILFGAQVAYAVQNRRAYLQEKQVENVNQRGREFIAFRMMTLVGQRFSQGTKAPTGSEMASVLGVPSRLVSRILQVLLDAALVVEVVGLETAYTPARPLEKITGQDILMALRTGQGNQPATRDEPTCQPVRDEYERILAIEQQAAGAVELRSLVERAQAAAAGHETA